LSIDLKSEKMAGLYTEKRQYSAKPSITTGAQSRVPVSEQGLLLGIGTGEAHGGYKPSATYPQP
jgi:hypothetical protein